ncbi:TAXI family TRAP transporter solute-binding subunit [Mariprofundus sp. NF]|uniref:TAXI family TRAP transporter solute-binding subunit n=1 Tax=Mariprofundus sp. NF TaxID=2608716 RepID=UPI0015A35EFF|nr:TAXI family TRAP transporter solute-binding subunit [Mariprofundus sp. NF]NWF39083.1 TAXI family TRAP transporter solute-binding subunit [Mariprofundus sp. NF]
MGIGEKLKTFTPAVVLTLIGFMVAYQFVDPAPPNTLTFSAGSKEGAYYAHALAYRDYLKQRGITVTVLESAGSLENVESLSSGKADVAFVQSGIADPDNSKLSSLGSMYYEPLWVFVRADITITSLNELKGKSIAVGPQGSGTRVLSLQLLQENGVDESTATLLPLSGNAAADALNSGKIDAVFLVAAASADAVWTLNQNTNVKLLNFSRADAYTRRIATLSALTLPQGSLDLGTNEPKQDMKLLAATATLLVSETLHPALQDLLMQAATHVHGGRSLFSTAGEFPTPLYTALPLSKEASRYYKSGPPFLQRYLPFWAATLLDRLKVMLLPFIALLIPLFKVMPPLYRWRVRSRIYRWYDELNRIDEALGSGFDQSQLDELDRIESEIRKVHVPLSYSDELYNLRMHLVLIRESAERIEG